MPLKKIISIALIFLILQTGCSNSKDSSAPQAPTEPATTPGSPDPVEPKTCLNQWGINNEWSSETEVQINGYTQNAMEPKVSADGGVLFWNDKPAGGDTLMNIHYAVKQADQSWLYIGLVPGTVDTDDLDGVPAIDALLNFYFVSLRTYGGNQQSIFSGVLNVLGSNSLAISSVASADTAIKNTQAGYLDMDIDISWDGGLMVVSRAFFAGNNYPEKSELKLFTVASRQATVLNNSDDILANVNSPLCRTYAATLSDDKKELYFTVMPVNSIHQNDFKILVAKRNSTTEPFGKPEIISGISSGFTEGPALPQDGKKLYYHRLDSASGRFKIYQMSR